ncbi:vacuolar protein sorting-associated protein-like protein 33A [Cryomyces antarcticus]
MAPHASINTQDIADKARRDLLQLLEGVHGKKNLVIEKALAGPVGLFVKFSTLQEYGVDRVFFLENDNVDSSQRNVVFLSRAEKAKQAQSIAGQIKRLRRTGSTNHEFSVFWVPRRTLVCDQILEEAGVLGEVNALEFPVYFVPLERDVLSLELDDSFSDLYLRKDPTSMFLAARALMLLQQSHGLFPRILGKGDNAKRLADLLLRMRSEQDVTSSADSSASSIPSRLGLTPSMAIDNLIIIDREIDLPTVLLTQLTYEGLIDEVFTIQNNQAEVDSSIVGAPPSQNTSSSSKDASQTSQTSALKRKIQLDSSDKLYAQLRDTNFAIVGGLLSKVARRLQADYESRHKANQTTSELRDFVAKLPGYQAEQASLKVHTSLAEEIMKHTRSDLFSRVLEVQQNLAAYSDPSIMHDNIEELIARDCPLTTVLRLLCLESCTANGLRPKDLDTFKRSILHAYGHQHLLTFAALEKIGLLAARTTSAAGYLLPTGGSSGGGAAGGGPRVTNYNAVRKTLKLIVDEVNESDPNDIAYVFSGYAPLSVRLVQAVIQKTALAQSSSATRGSAAAAPPASAAGTAGQGWTGFESALASIRGATVDETQVGSNKDAMRARNVLAGGGGAGQEKTTVVFFLGGVTFAEIAALRFVAAKEEGRRRVIVATTGIVAGDRVVGAAIEKRGFGAS